MRTALLAFAALCLVCGLGYYAGGRVSAGRATAEIAALQATEAEARRAEDDIKAREIAAAKIDAAKADGRAMDAGIQVEQLKAKLARIKETSASPLPGLPPVVGVVDGPLVAIVAVQSQLISAQDTKILALEDAVKGRDRQIAGLNKALELADRRADIQAQASKAALAGIKKGRWLGRLEGFALGAALGYATRGAR